MIKYLYIVIVVIGILVLSYIPSLSLPFVVKGMIYCTIFLLVVLIIKKISKKTLRDYLYRNSIHKNRRLRRPPVEFIGVMIEFKKYAKSV